MATLDNARWLNSGTGLAESGTTVFTEGSNSTEVTGTFTAGAFSEIGGVTEFGAFEVSSPITANYQFSNPVENLSFDLQHVNDDASHDDQWTIYAYDENGVLIPAADVIAGISGLVDESVVTNPDGSVSIIAAGGVSNDVSFSLPGLVSELELVLDNGPGASLSGGSGISDLSFNIPAVGDTDGDGIADDVDVDDDNDGILDVDEGVETYQNIATALPTASGASIVVGDTTVTYTDPTGNTSLWTANGGDIPFGATSNTIDGFDLSLNDAFTVDFDATENAGVAFSVADFDSAESVTIQAYDIDGNLIEDITPYLQYEGTNTTVTSGTSGESAVVSTGVVSGTNTFDPASHTDFYISIPISQLVFTQTASGGGTAEVYITQIDGIDDTDGDGNADHLDIDSDNDGITDNVEAQSTDGYAAPTGLDADNDGLDDAYETGGVTPVDSDGDGTADFLDTDSDNDGYSDTDEAGHGITQAAIDAGVDSDGDGLVDAVDDVDGWDVNDADLNGSGDFTLADSDGDVAVDGTGAVPLLSDFDFRDVGGTDTDGDGIVDFIDVDDDNDGILDVDEGLGTAPSTITITFDGDEWSSSGSDNTRWTLEFPDGSTISDEDIDASEKITNISVDGFGEYTFTVFDDFGDGLSGTDPASYSVALDGNVIIASAPNDDFGGALSVVHNFTITDTDTDGDGIVDYLDLDSDNDGITDNVEAQTTQNYIAPTGTDSDNDGLDDAYETGGLSPVDSDGDLTADYLDSDSDGDGISDTDEAGHGITQAAIDASADTDGDGIKDVVDDVVGWDVNDADIDGSGDFTLADSDGDVDADGSNAAPLANDLDYRDTLVGDYIVEGDGSANLIDSAYTDDPDGDRIDSSDHFDGSDDDCIDAGAGDDTVLAGDGDDTINGGDGNDSLSGGDGNDLILGDASLASPVFTVEYIDVNGLTNNTEATTLDTYFDLTDGTIDVATGDTAPSGAAITVNPFGTGSSGDLDPETQNGLIGYGDTFGHAFLFSTQIEVSGGTYTFDADFYNSAAIYVDGVQVFLSESLGANTASGSISLTAGTHDLVILYAKDATATEDDLNVNISGGEFGPTPSPLQDAKAFGTITGVGDDTINGGAGDDTMDGQTGDDTFVLEDGFGNDVIIGGETGETTGDTIDVSSLTSGIDLTYTSTDAEGGTITSGGDSATFSEIENTSATSFDDTIDASAVTVDMNIDGLAGDDSVVGGSGDDTILGGVGDDTVTGGAGTDSLTGGSGDDTFTYSVGDGTDTISDFNTGNTGTLDDGDNTNNDFIDLNAFYDNLSELYADYADDGVLNQSNATDSKGRTVDYTDNSEFDPGDGLTFIGGTDDNSFFTVENTNVVCFAEGTMIATPNGEIAVEDLKVGDLISTMDNDNQTLRWIGMQEVPAERHFAPILIRQGALGGSLPKRDLRVSPQHRMLVTSPIVERMFGARSVLSPAKALTELPGIDIEDQPGRNVRYYHMLFDAHEIVFAEGAPSESLHTGQQAMSSLAEASRNEILSLFPNLNRPSARKLVPVQRSRKLAERHAKNQKALIG